MSRNAIVVRLLSKVRLMRWSATRHVIFRRHSVWRAILGRLNGIFSEICEIFTRLT
jgi:hypothetical protein